MVPIPHCGRADGAAAGAVRQIPDDVRSVWPSAADVAGHRDAVRAEGDAGHNADTSITQPGTDSPTTPPT
jgi:hypothetical protein